MIKLFGLPVFIAIFAGISFPYFALSLMPFGVVFLFMLMLWSGISIDWRRISSVMKRPLDITLGLFFLFFFFPLLQLLLAKILITDKQLLLGLIFSSLTPAAIVAPLFSNTVDGDEELSFILLLLSMTLSPLIIPLLLKFFAQSILPIDFFPLFKIMLLLVTLPLIISYLVARFMPGIKLLISSNLALLNMLTLSALIFILFGTAVGRLNLHYEQPTEIFYLLLLAFVQDFGVLFLARLLLPWFFTASTANTLIVTLSMKNVAIAAGILLFYDPKASLAPALGFVAHAFLFSFIPIFKKWLIVKEKVGSIQQ
ncbi:MAG: hypothetical protein KJ630_09565 [Proteobacteria bacterium]|nr:hypothetical protein [Pseudomonadota bacterium]